MKSLKNKEKIQLWEIIKRGVFLFEILVKIIIFKRSSDTGEKYYLEFSYVDFK